MVDKQTVINALPARNYEKMVVYEQSTADIIDYLLAVHKMFETDYDCIYQFFETGYVPDDCRGVFDFLKKNVPYTIEHEDKQTLKSPYMILQSNVKVDCKNYALFIGGVLDAINVNNGLKFHWVYRFAGYKKRRIEHVFVVLEPGTENEVWIDPVLNYFDYELDPVYYIDKRV